MRDSQRQEYIKALLRERESYVLKDMDDRVKQVDAELKKVGHKARKPQQRAQTR